MKRRSFLKKTSGLLTAAAIARIQKLDAQESSASIIVDPKPLHDISPRLYMQFMEPLGVTDSSVEAAWSYDVDDWRKDFVDLTKDLRPGVLRWGGLISRYYKWHEGV